MRKALLSVLFGVLIITTTIFAYKFFETRKLKKELESLLGKSIYSVERDNRNIYWELESILLDTYMAEKYPRLKSQWDALVASYNTTQYVDSLMIADSLIPTARKHIQLNNSMLEFYEGFNIHSRTLASIIYFTRYFEHKPIYQYGDTVNYVVNLRNPPYLLENTFELIDFTNEQYGFEEYNELTYSLPTTDFMGTGEKQKEVEFSYRLVIRNTYSNELDTSYHSTKFVIHR